LRRWCAHIIRERRYGAQSKPSLETSSKEVEAHNSTRIHIAAVRSRYPVSETVLGAEHGGYCAAVDASGAAES
jgi:hypothetical protein